MKKIQFTEPGGPEVLEYVDAPMPEPGEGEILVRAHSMGVGIPDTVIRAGRYRWMPPLPCTPGTEMSGYVEALGPGVTSHKVGQPVYVTARERSQRGGFYAEYVATEADSAFVLPDNIEMEQAAALANYQVGYHLLRDGARATKGQSVLVHAAAGGMGNALIDLAREIGMTVIGVVGSDEKAAFAREMGAHHAVNRRTEDVVARVKELTDGEGVDLIIDPVGGDTVPANVSMLGNMGLLIIYGGLGGPVQGDIHKALQDNVARCPAIRRFTIHNWDHRPEARRAGMRDLIAKLAAGTIHPRIYRRLPLSQAAEAHRLIEAGDTMGKILLQP